MQKQIECLLGISVDTLTDIKGINTSKEILQQPETWKEATQNLVNNKDEIKAFMDKFKSIENSRIILAGAGTSAFAGETIELYLTNLLGRRVEAIATTDLVSTPKNYFIKDTPTLLISFARSGNSPESIHAVTLANQLVD
ncbi:MAG: SIS domain-containing protein, partial [Romboutsia sp.]|uniref:SIS domain-containing protein n=1 Tax=Romboutsia sp. TaxID=1965302 RepID=UPI003F3BB5A5